MLESSHVSHVFSRSGELSAIMIEYGDAKCPVLFQMQPDQFVFILRYWW